ncbi:MAG: aminoglycoside phosphotransferase family protein [Gammaproteobacteria bacterium]|nr:aminoglycoside phosphotransferase family protein [Gammaproteobacteria bacterium]
MSDAARRALAAWLSAADAAVLSPLGNGHINDTWLVETAASRFVLQRISAAVFADPRGVADKVARVVSHLRGGGRVNVPELLPTAAGNPWLEDAGGVWRLWEFVAGGRTLERLTRPAQAEAAGAAFGHFQRALADFGVAVADPIPGFLCLQHYLAELDTVLAAAVTDRAVDDLLAAVATRTDLRGLFEDRDRLVHGDCKVNNLLFHPDRAEVVCVLDLDTVMCGHWAWDFGDLARSAAARGERFGERFDVALFAAAARGFTAAAGIPVDRDALLLAPRYVALMLGVRFLTDHLRGDRYFKVAARGDNLARARAQLALLEDMEAREADLRAALGRAVGSGR